MAEVHGYYLQDLGVLLREQAVEARDRAFAVPADPSNYAAFEAGRWQAYWEVLSLMVQQASAFELPLKDIGLTGWEPDIELAPKSR